MDRLNIYAFADEASGMIDGQIKAMLRNRLNGLEIRGVDGQSISDISEQKAKEVRKKLDDAGLTVWSLGSPIGKTDINSQNFDTHLEALRRTLGLADILDAENVRMFSFFVLKGEAERYRAQVMDRMGKMVRIAEGSGKKLCHENEKGIYGDNAVRCLELLEIFPQLDGIFDPANFIQCGQETREAWDMLKNRIRYLHIKDALEDGRVVPAGRGIGHVKEILDDYRALGGKNVTVEPHLSVFDGLKDLEREGLKTQIDSYRYPDSDTAFDAACNALKDLL